MTSVPGASMLRPSGRRPPTSGRDRLITAVVASLVAVGGVLAPSSNGSILLFVAVGGAVTVLALVDPTAALVLLMTTALLRVAIHGTTLDIPLPALLMLVAVAGLVVAVARGVLPMPRLGMLEVVMGLYLSVNVVSWLLPHALPAQTSVPVLIATGIALPFLVYVLARAGSADPRAAPLLRWWIVAVTAYTALTAWLQFQGPTSLVWPRYILDASPWHGRATGIFNQPVTNGILLVIGLIVCLWIGGQAASPRWQRWTAHAVAAGAVYGIYATHTRAVWLATALVLIAAPFVSRVYRRGALLILGTAVLGALLNWATLTGSDRAAGGVGSSSEIDDRLNMIATALPALRSEPLLGWGIGRFQIVNRLYHEPWSETIDWSRGYGIAAHETELGVGVELGLVGLALWVGILVLLIRRVLAAHRRGDDPATSGIAVLAVLVVVVAGATVDIRYLDFASILVFLLAGLAVGPGRPAPPPPVVATERVRVPAPA